MKSFIIIITLALFVSNITFSARYRVNNTAGTDPDYTSLSAAITAISSYDTIYLEGSTTSYGSITLTKPVIIFGPGYFLDKNDSTQFKLLTANLQNITFNSGAQGSVIMGLEIINTSTSTSPVSAITIYDVSNITVKRCRLKNYTSYNFETVLIDNTNYSVSNINISQNYIEGGIYLTPNSSSKNMYNIVIYNNIVSYTGSSYGAIYCNTSYPYMSASIYNNITLNNKISVYNSTIRNNIVNGIIEETARNNTIEYNLVPGTAPSGTGNIGNVNFSALYAGGASTDGAYKLSTNSPAKNAGLSSIDCGVYGGSTPYIPSGMPPIPHIFYLSAPNSASPSSGLPVNIKAKSQN